MPILKIECGQEINSEQSDMDLGSEGTNNRFNRPPQKYVIFTTCPVVAGGATDPIKLKGHIGLTVPQACDITDMKDQSAAEAKLLSGGEKPYKCSRFSTPRCPLSSNTATS